MSYYETVREALIAAQELKSKVLHEQGELQGATHRLTGHMMELQDVIWRLQYELQTRGAINQWGDIPDTAAVSTADQFGDARTKRG